MTVQEQLKKVAEEKAQVTGLETELLATAITQGGTSKVMLFWFHEGGILRRYRIPGMTQNTFVLAPASALVKMLEEMS